MARRLTAALILALCGVALGGADGRAQSLQRLTIDAFTLGSDASRPALDVPFHLIVTLHVRQRVGAIDNLELPILAQLELLGDERRIVAGSAGTEYRETIAVIAHRAGAIAISPATLQAIDARDGRAKQYFTNGLTLQVAGATSAPFAQGASLAVAAIQLTVRAALWAAGIVCAIALVLLVFRRRRPLALTVPPAAEPAPLPALARSPREQLADALTVLRAEPTRASAVRVRSAVWRMVGASEGETLADVLYVAAAGEARMRDVLRALERAAFTYDADLAGAIASACAALERYLA